MGVSIVHDDPLFVACERCDGTADAGGELCTDCYGSGEMPVDLSAFATLAHNLAIASALCDVWYRALDEAENHRLYHEHGYRTATCWSPGCGHTAPGWGR